MQEYLSNFKFMQNKLELGSIKQASNLIKEKIRNKYFICFIYL